MSMTMTKIRHWTADSWDDDFEANVSPQRRYWIVYDYDDDDDYDEDDFEGNVSPQQLDSGGVIELSTKLLSKCGTPSTRQPTDSQCDKWW